MDRKLIGIPASPGIAVGPVHLLRWEVPEVRQRIIPTTRCTGRSSASTTRSSARRSACARCATASSSTAGPQEAAIFDVQRSILDDQELTQAVEELIRQNLGAEKAFEIVMFEWSAALQRARAIRCSASASAI